MKTFHCACGQRLFFDNSRCINCGLAVGFDPDRMEIVVLDDAVLRCRNGLEHDNCNWLRPASSGPGYCRSCALNEVIPNLEVPGNLVLWSRLESAKRRLLYDLLSLGLPFAGTQGLPGLGFRFMEDRRRNPEVLEDFVTTGHEAGVITINLAEADDVERTAFREQMRERYRTLLGHLRHESGHYYRDWLLDGSGMQARWQHLFGDVTIDYAKSLRDYYAHGPQADWWLAYVSAYATAHPHEDWAETFAHYLHIRDALETAYEAGLARIGDGGRPGWILEWMRLSVTLNELNRSLGADDPYPFLLTDPVVEKLEFVAYLFSRRAG